MEKTLTNGPHHIGLTVSKLEQTAAFFTEILGWNEVKRNEEYPAIFVSDGHIMLTLWAVKEAPEVSFNRKSNVGLHHLALQVSSEAALAQIYQRLTDNQIEIEFSPEPLNNGPTKHMMCLEPSGIRVEFIWPSQ
ncbi:MAG: glyoxalase [Porticoccaceae bacterium]|nr:MAG: glyoxalase [Porticoccaceae bacterium]